MPLQAPSIRSASSPRSLIPARSGSSNVSASAEKRAGYSGAHAHVMTAVGRQMELGKVRGHAVHLGGGHAEVRGDLGQRVFADPAVSMLDGLEGGKEPLTLARELREDGIEGFDHEGWGG